MGGRAAGPGRVTENSRGSGRSHGSAVWRDGKEMGRKRARQEDSWLDESESLVRVRSWRHKSPWTACTVEVGSAEEEKWRNSKTDRKAQHLRGRWTRQRKRGSLL